MAEHFSHRRPDIQGLRALAVLVVVIYHAGLPLPGGFVGVDMFFVISGYVITAMLKREWDATGRIDFGRFYQRRFKRLTPALALVLTVTLVLSVLFSGIGSLVSIADTAIAALFLSANVVIARTTGDYFAASTAVTPVLHIWSLSVEEQFYLAFPLLMALSWAAARHVRRRHLAPVLAVTAVLILSFVLAMISWLEIALPIPLSLYSFYSPLTRAWEFAAGALLVLVPAKWTQLSRAASLVSGVTGAVLVAVSLVAINGERAAPGVWTPYPGLELLLPVVGTVLLIVAGQHHNSVTQSLSVRPLTVLGDWSYAIYLWHWPMIVFAQRWWPTIEAAAWLGAAGSFIPAFLSYRYVEQPLRLLPDNQWPRLAAIAGLVVGIPLTSGLLLRQLPGSSYLRESAFYRAIVETPQPGARGCHGGKAFSAENLLNCVWNKSAPGMPMYLVGDSHAWHFSAPVITAGLQLGSPVSIITAKWCPLIEDLTLGVINARYTGIVPVQRYEHCPVFTAFVLEHLAESPPGIVIIGGIYHEWRTSAVMAMAVGKGLPVAEPLDKSLLLLEGLESTVQRLNAMGHRVVLIQPVPNLRGNPSAFDPRNCSLPMIVWAECQANVNLSFYESEQSTIWGVIRKVAERSRANLLDLRDWFCPSGVCSSEKDGIPVYRDDNHITTAASRALTPLFIEAIRAAEAAGR